MNRTGAMSANIKCANTYMHVAIEHRVEGARLTKDDTIRLRSIISKCEQILEGRPKSSSDAAARAYEEATNV